MSDYIPASTTIDSVNHQLLFTSEGYYVVGDEMWNDVTFHTSLIYKGGTIGIAPRVYDTNMYMYLTIHNETKENGTAIGLASLDAQVTYNSYHISQVTLAPLVVGNEYRFRTEIKGTNYRIFLNDTILLNIEYPAMPKGKVGVFATAGNICKSIEVKTAFAEAWETNINAVPGAIASTQERENKDRYLFLSNPTTKELWAKQTLELNRQQTNSPFTLSFHLKGNTTVKILAMDGTVLSSHSFSTADWTPVEKSGITIAPTHTKIQVAFCVKEQEACVNHVQLEEKAFATDYIENESITAAKKREASVITYPAKDNIRGDMGSLVMWFSPGITYDGLSEFEPVLFEYGEEDPLRLSYEFGEVRFHYGDADVAYPITLTKGNWYNVVATWSSSRIRLYVNGTLIEESGNYSEVKGSTLIRIGHSIDPNKDTFYGAIDETIVLSSLLGQTEVEQIQTSIEPIANSNSMTMRATFNHAIGNFNKSIIEATLAPNYGSPVLVEKLDGTPMRKVSFFDFYTGEYRTFNEELVEYDKTYNYVEISYHDKDVDQESFQIGVEDISGHPYGAPYELRGRRLYLSLTEEEKKQLDGQYLYVTYQLEDAYTVDFNIGVPDSFRVTLGKHEGQPVKVTYEGNRFTDEKLLTMVEMNPMLNPNHEGFLYVTRNDEKVTSFRTRLTPESLPANGGSEALLVVEPLDSYGNYVSHCRLTVTSELGTIIPAYDEESVKLRDRAGRFLYRYHSPILTTEQAKGFETTDYINVIDNETGFGVQESITLTALLEKVHPLSATDTIETIAEKYGSTIEEVAYTEDMIAKVKATFGTNGTGKVINKVVEDARAYILKKRTTPGIEIKVPINYSAKHLQLNSTAIEHDRMIAHLTELLIDHMGVPVKALPEGFGRLLDFNQDGVIGIQEINWLRENRLTSALQEVYKSIISWQNTK